MLLENLFAGITIAVVTSIITVWLAFKRFRSERWWDRKADAYSAIIESLHHMKRYCEKNIDVLESHRDMSDEERTDLYTKFKEGVKKIEKAKDIGCFIISNEAVKQLDLLLQGLYSAEGARDFYEYLERQLSVINNCLNSICEIAKSDLKVK